MDRSIRTVVFWIAVLASVTDPAIAQQQDAIPQTHANPDPAISGSTPAVDPAATAPVPVVAADATPTGSGQPAQLEQVVVTATKRREATRDIPMSINAFKGTDLEHRGDRGLEQILQFSPGVSIAKNTSDDNNDVSIRGIASSGVNNVYTRPTGLFLDDVSLSNPSLLSVLPDVDPWDLKSVEVLKGPQGTLFGGSALSGAIRYIPNEPRLSRNEFKLSATGSQESESDHLGRSYDAMVNAAVGDGFAVRGSIVDRYTPGYIDDTRSGEKDINTSKTVQSRLGILLQPWDFLSLEPTYFYRRFHSDNGNALTDVDSGTVDTRVHASPTDSKVMIPGLRGKLDIGPVEVVSVISDLHIHGAATTDLSPSLGLGSTTAVQAFEPFISTVNQPTYELRFVSTEPLFGVSYLAGIYYMLSQQTLQLNTTVSSDTLLPASALGAIGTLVGSTLGQNLDLSQVQVGTDLEAKATERAFFFDLKRTFFGHFDLDLGGRGYIVDTKALDTASYLGATLPNVPPTPIAAVNSLADPIALSQSDKGFNPKAALTWKPSKRFSVYATVVRGFRFGGINAVDAPEAVALNIPYTFHSDSLWNYESGIRTDWLHGRMTVDVTGFDIYWKNPQILQLADGAIGYTANVGSARVKGIESQIRNLLPWGFSTTISGAYIDSRTASPFDSSTGEVPRGTRLPTTPFLTGSAILSNTQHFHNWQFVTGYTLTYHGASTNDLADDYPLHSYVLHGASFYVTRPDWSYRPELNFSVTNLLNRHTVLFGETTPGVPLLVGTQPRVMMLTLTLSH